MSASSINVAQGSGLRARISAWYEGSAWAPLAAKTLAYLAAFGALALVGSGAAGGWLSKAAGASAVPLSSASAAAPPSAAPLALRPEAAAPPEEASDAGAGASADAGPAALSDAGAGALGDKSVGPSADPGAGSATGSAAEKRAPPVSGVTPDGKVVLNAATEEDLRRLPGIGPSKAKAILALRAKLGRFKRPEDLLRVKGIGRKRLARLRSLLIVEPPS